MKSRQVSSAAESQILAGMVQSLGQHISQLQADAEKRVRLFFTLASLLVAFFTAGPTVGYSTDIPWPVARLVVLAILLIYGIETLHSISWLIVNVRENTKLEKALRQRLSELLPSVIQINTILDDAESRKSQVGQFRKTVRGSLPEFMYLSNTLLAVGIAIQGCTLFGQMNTCGWILACAIFLVAPSIQYWYSHWLRDVLTREWVDE